MKGGWIKREDQTYRPIISTGSKLKSILAREF